MFLQLTYFVFYMEFLSCLLYIAKIGSISNFVCVCVRVCVCVCFLYKIYEFMYSQSQSNPKMADLTRAMNIIAILINRDLINR